MKLMMKKFFTLLMLSTVFSFASDTIDEEIKTNATLNRIGEILNNTSTVGIIKIYREFIAPNEGITQENNKYIL
jgi:hypothetical protein